MGLAARHREARRYVGLAADAVDLGRVAGACRFGVVEAGGGFARLRCGLSWFSLGEKIEVHATVVDGGLVVDVVSVCVLPIHFEDWGKNARNVRRFFEALEQQVRPAEAERVPCCVECGYLLAGIDGSKCPECGLRVGETPEGPSAFVRKVRLALIIGLVLTGVEMLAIFALQALGFRLGRFEGASGAVILVSANVAGVVGVVLLRRLVKRER